MTSADALIEIVNLYCAAGESRESPPEVKHFKWRIGFSNARRVGLIEDRPAD